MPLIVKMWRNYAKQSLEKLSEILLAAEPHEDLGT